MQSEDTLYPSSPMPGTPVAPSRHTERRHGRPDTTCVHYLNYGLTCDQYDDMRRRAGERCEICQTPEAETTRGMLVVDHFQGGGAWFVRGMLCDRCNSVMSRHDRAAVWGPASLPFQERAAEYHRNAYGKPTPEEFQKAADYIAARKPFNVADVPRPVTPKRTTAPRKAQRIRLDRGVRHLAHRLLQHLSPAQLNHLIELLKKGEL
ncbi:endonuclease domain-containing protein [Streptomyces sp. ME02-6979-3A]|uniref:endonuclease domain-containing protein n=1 Tax=Streptomyces sp. ME02-6979-3A TaxID=3028673 RepID=UPI0029B8EAC0|nr:endonuclease domain-containing protein [Streptomyces sp. ME02-6979-3A]MDX3328826.1 endonuclease domain-containing protein [Streptomyces sp. ME02-6979-3A]